MGICINLVSDFTVIPAHTGEMGGHCIQWYLVDKKGNSRGLTELAGIPEIPIIHHLNYTLSKNTINKA